MPLLHMETDLVRSVGNQVQQTAVSLQQQTQQLNHSMQALSNAWQGPSTDVFISEIHPLLQQLQEISSVGETLNQRLQREVEEWERIANSILSGTVIAAMTMPIAGGGEILGASTVDLSGKYQDMTWLEKSSELQRFEGKIAALEQELRDQLPVDDRVNEIDEEIAQLETQMDEAQKDASAWYNKAIPTWPFQKDDDGAPWRVRTDNYEDDITGYEQQIKELQKEKSDLLAQDKQDQLAAIKTQHVALQTIITNGIPADGPASKYSAFQGTITENCTKHAAAKRYFPDEVNGHAYRWDDQAKSVGYEVGTQPVKGSIMVFEPGIRGYHEQFGHVAFVERVEPLTDGTYKVTFTDNNHPDPTLCEKYDVPYQKASWPDHLIVTPGEQGISFIYE